MFPFLLFILISSFPLMFFPFSSLVFPFLLFPLLCFSLFLICFLFPFYFTSILTVFLYCVRTCSPIFFFPSLHFSPLHFFKKKKKNLNSLFSQNHFSKWSHSFLFLCFLVYLVFPFLFSNSFFLYLNFSFIPPFFLSVFSFINFHFLFLHLCFCSCKMYFIFSITVHF